MSSVIKGPRRSLIHSGEDVAAVGPDICQQTHWIPNVIVGLTGSLQDAVLGEGVVTAGARNQKNARSSPLFEEEEP